jgi:hypothetical protein
VLTELHDAVRSFYNRRTTDTVWAASVSSTDGQGQSTDAADATTADGAAAAAAAAASGGGAAADAAAVGTAGGDTTIESKGDVELKGGDVVSESDTNKALRDVIARIDTVMSSVVKTLSPALLGPDDSAVHVVVLADAELQTLPLELMSLLSDPRLASVSRDFSLEVLLRRLDVVASASGAGDKGGRGGGGKKGKKGASSVVNVPASLNNTVVAVDPARALLSSAPLSDVRSDLPSESADAKSTERVAESSSSSSSTAAALSDCFNAIRATVPASEKSWRPAVPSDGSALAPAVFVNALYGADVLVNLGPNNLLSETSDAVLRSLPLKDCKAALCFDHCARAGVHSSSDQQQHEKQQQQQPLPRWRQRHVRGGVGAGVHDRGGATDDAYALAGVLTLRGALLIGLNQWTSTSDDTVDLARSVLTTSTAGACGCVGTAVQCYRTGVNPLDAAGGKKDKKKGGASDKKPPKGKGATPSLEEEVPEVKPPTNLAKCFNFVTFGLPHVELV